MPVCDGNTWLHFLCVRMGGWGHCGRMQKIWFGDGGEKKGA